MPILMPCKAVTCDSLESDHGPSGFPDRNWLGSWSRVWRDHPWLHPNVGTRLTCGHLADPLRLVASHPNGARQSGRAVRNRECVFGAPRSAYARIVPEATCARSPRAGSASAASAGPLHLEPMFAAARRGRVGDLLDDCCHKAEAELAGICDDACLKCAALVAREEQIGAPRIITAESCCTSCQHVCRVWRARHARDIFSFLSFRPQWYPGIIRNFG